MNIYLKNMTLFIAFILIGCNHGESTESNIDHFTDHSSESIREQTKKKKSTTTPPKTPEITKIETVKPVSTVPPISSFADSCATQSTKDGLEITCKSHQLQLGPVQQRSPTPLISPIDPPMEIESKIPFINDAIQTTLDRIATEINQFTKDATDIMSFSWEITISNDETEDENVVTSNIESPSAEIDKLVSTVPTTPIIPEIDPSIEYEKIFRLLIEGMLATLDQAFAKATDLTRDAIDKADLLWFKYILTGGATEVETTVIDTIPLPSAEITDPTIKSGRTDTDSPVMTWPKKTPEITNIEMIKPVSTIDVIDTIPLPSAEITVPTIKSVHTDTVFKMDSTNLTVPRKTPEITNIEMIKPVSTMPTTPSFSDLCTTLATENGLVVSCKPQPTIDVIDTIPLPSAEITVPTIKSIHTDTDTVLKMDSTNLTVPRKTPEITNIEMVKPVSTMPTTPSFSDSCATLSTKDGLEVSCKPPKPVQLRNPTPTASTPRHVSYPTDIGVPDNCPLPAPAEVSNQLLITEVGHYYNNYKTWIEIYNAYPHAVDLSHFEVRSGFYLLHSVRKTLTLPRIVLQPGKHFVIEVGKGTLKTDQLYQVDSDRYKDPLYWSESQTFIELFHRRSQRVEDYVAWSEHTYHHAEDYVDDQTLSAVQQRAIWQGPFLDTWQATQYQTSFMRSYPYQDTNTAADWQQSSFVTKGGVNDTSPDARDDDRDGIPDSAERDPCATYNGLPYYAWGARPNQRDLFIEIDHMDRAGYAFATTTEAIQLMQAAYAQHRPYRIALHVDTGRVHSDQQQIDLKNHNLYTPNGIRGINGGQAVPYRQYATIGVGQHSTIADLDRYTVKHMDLRRAGMFHYILLADTFIQFNGTNYEPNASTTGYAYVTGSNLLITFGSQEQQPTGWSMQLASTIVHEMGHNFGLSHGGLDRINRKINHPSVMNYLYSNYGVPNRQSRTRESICYKSIYGSSASGIAQQRIDYSHGLHPDIDEESLRDRQSIYQRLHGTVLLSCEQYGTYYYSGGDINEDGYLNVHKDYNEWAHIIHHFDYKRKQYGHRKEAN
ncbi:MAG: hypothetical protein ISP86_01285 [Shewanellaceae bacterium]|nr:hypothetical protein [Shewanellaceae bacterium]